MVHDYRRMIAEIGGKKMADEPSNVTHKDFDWNTPQNEWSATVYYRDGIPFHFGYHIWNCSAESFSAGLLEAIGPDYKLANDHCGNGHGDADIVPK